MNKNRILSVNPAVKNMFGYQPDELIGQNISKLFLEMMGDNKEKSSDFLTLLNKE